MTDKQLKRLALAQGWIKERNGSKHEKWVHKSGNVMCIPYKPKQHTARLIAKQLVTLSAAQ